MNESRIAVVTGATAGIGHAAAKLLVQSGIRVIGVGRDKERCRTAKAAIVSANAGADIEYVTGDLSTTGSVREIAGQIKNLLGDGRLDILMNVAGTVSTRQISTPEDCELQFAVNHLAPFLLTKELLPCLLKAPDARILVVSSRSHYRTRIRWSDVMMRRRYSCLTAYKQSKLCNVLFAAELTRRLYGTSATVYTIDPGLTDTEIGLKNTSGIEHLIWKLRRRGGNPPEIPAGYMVAIATRPEYAGKSGLYWLRDAHKKPSRTARDPRQAVRLWELSEQLCGIDDYFAGCSLNSAKS